MLEPVQYARANVTDWLDMGDSFFKRHLKILFASYSMGHLRLRKLTDLKKQTEFSDYLQSILLYATDLQPTWAHHLCKMVIK
jgi:hypothetical protein